MSFFQKLKKDIGIEEEIKEEKPRKKIPKKKREIKKKETSIKEEISEEKVEKVSISPKKSASDWLKAEGQLAVDVYQTETEFCVQAPIAGVEPEDIDISIENEMLIIKGERREPEQNKEKNYFYQECYWGPFSRQIILPEDVDIQRVKATLKKGILTIKIPRVRRVKKKKIVIQTVE
ncbi:MAG: Hsp20/alpha crystallin family protein [Candidatus Nealsonbacteria bacterium]|nr:MAG: Hsp20/alpha crystallin family protein [Candidatus Nealsonbacteria bacterium]